MLQGGRGHRDSRGEETQRFGRSYSHDRRRSAVFLGIGWRINQRKIFCAQLCRRHS